MLESASLMIPSFTLLAFAVVCAEVFPDRRVNDTKPAKMAISVRRKDPREQVAMTSPEPALAEHRSTGSAIRRGSFGAMIFIV
jgi:hypothetical protein